MLRDSWLPHGHRPKDGVEVRRRVAAGEQWQIYECAGGQRVLVAQDDLAERWLQDKLLAEAQVFRFGFGRMPLVLIEGGREHRLEAVDGGEPPRSLGEVQALVAAIVASRACGCRAAFNDAVYLERLSRLLPDYSPNDAVDDALVAGFWTSGGVNQRLAPSRRMTALVPWIGEDELKALATTLENGALVPVEHAEAPAETATAAAPGERAPGTLPAEPFRLPGRPHLEEFFNEHVVDLVRNEARYKALGIHFPGAILLHGPPGCGKTFAVDALVEYLDWPSFPVDSGSIGSPYIHETGRKIAEVFAKAADAAPAVVVIDEIDAFLAARDNAGHNQHRVEEVAEFLRGIPKAADSRVLVIGMTNRLDSLDPAIVRRGRFDHILDVGMPSQQEILALLQVRMSQIPSEPGLDLPALAQALAGRPLSDLGFILKDACRRAARSGLDQVGQTQIDAALAAAPSRLPEEKKARRIGFI
jgi:cell division protease FtsH